MRKKFLSAFTLLELIIVVAIVALIAVVLLVLLNPWQQIGRAYDAKRKNDLATLRKVLEDYYNDKSCFPLPSQLCYDSPVTLYKDGTTPDSYTCHICGRESASPSFSPYLPILPCDPQHKTKQYLYQVQAAACPTWYRLYVDLSINADQDGIAAGCGIGGCGPANPPNPIPPFSYDLGMASSNTELETSPQFNCLTRTGKCNTCITYKKCLIDIGCPDKNKIYGTYQICCLNNPGACK